MLLKSIIHSVLISLTIFATHAFSDNFQNVKIRTDNGLQDVVTWDSHSLIVHGKRVLIMSGEIHPWRIPVPSLWIDIFEKVKALGFNTISFYVHWGLVEYAKDDFNFDGYLSLEPLFEAAKKTGIYLIARPGPYINAETTGGGTPGWGTRVPGAWRTDNQTYIDAMEGYVRAVSKILAKEQITEGGPLILVQPENEYSYCFEIPNCPVPWPQPGYMEKLQKMMREEGLVVPTITNEVQYTSSNYAPGSGRGEVDIRGYDNYPLSFICNDTATWPNNKLPINFWEVNHNLSGGNPNSILEMQAGAHGRWGWFSTEDCSILTGSSFERVFYKNYVSFSTTIFNLYMLYGGTNWGGIASPATITSYDYGAAIKENRLLTREKYSELKLLAQFLRVSPAYTTTRPLNQYPVNTVNGSVYTTNSDLAVTQLADVVGNRTTFWIVRHAAYNSLQDSRYKLQVPTSRGNISIPSLGGQLTLNGRDSKIHVSDYDVGGTTVLYSSGEILTWKKFSSKTVLVVHGFPGEIHETAFLSQSRDIQQVDGDALKNSSSKDGIVTINYQITKSQTVIAVGEDLQVVVVNRNEAFDFWTPEWNGGAAIVRSPYLIRSAEINPPGTLAVRGDLNQTKVDAEIFADGKIHSLTFNGRAVSVQKTVYGSLKFQIRTSNLKVSLPKLEGLDWRYIDGLPEVKTDYDDSKWTAANLINTTNPRKPTTPTSLYSSDYGFHTGNILWRGHFVATGKENSFTVQVQGGSAFSASMWLDDKQIAYFPGVYNVALKNLTGTTPILQAGSKHVITILQDHMGLEQNYGPGGDLHKIPRGILNYDFGGLEANTVTWKVTGNLGGEHPVDRVRAPVNEGGLFAERQGFHQPDVGKSLWRRGSPLDGLTTPGVRFYSTTFDLNIPSNLDAPISFNIANNTAPQDFRALLYVNGYQFGKYASNLGPQSSFPVPEGILNHRGRNTVAVSLWAMSLGGAKLGSFLLKTDGVIETSMYPVVPMPQPSWKQREDAY